MELSQTGMHTSILLVGNSLALVVYQDLSVCNRSNIFCFNQTMFKWVSLCFHTGWWQLFT